MSDYITIQGANEHNLQNLELKIKRNTITIITGVSGSGKSSLAFDTILAEAQRRFFYTLSHYSRQFLDLGNRPKVKSLGGLSPAIALAQNETNPSKRASVGTFVDLTELLGVLLARFGEQLCPTHSLPTTKVDVDIVMDRWLKTYDGKVIAVTGPIAENKKGVFKNKIGELNKKGYLRLFIDGKTYPTNATPTLKKEERHTIKLITDYVKIKPGCESRLKRAVQSALEEGEGYCELFNIKGKQELDVSTCERFSSKSGCPECGFSWPKLDPRYFSPNSLGRCPECDGIGYFELENGFTESCEHCEGVGVDPTYGPIKFNGWNVTDLQKMTLNELHKELFKTTPKNLADNEAFLALRKEISGILKRINTMGIGYLNPHRRMLSLSGGELQRLKLANILAESMRGVLYVLDEPSQGLHPTELETLVEALENLKQQGNTIILVDHDEFLMKHADHIIDMGPRGGEQGGQLIAQFHYKEAAKYKNVSLTAKHLTDKVAVKEPKIKKESEAKMLSLVNLSKNNLKIPQVDFLLQGLNVITGVSGAGKSSLVLHTLYPNLYNALHPEEGESYWYDCEDLTGYEDLDKVYLIDRKPIAKSSVSIPATYLDVYTDIRNLFASLPDAQIAGATARSFSLNSEGGRCEHCKGKGEEVLSMRFLSDARVGCIHCDGKRFKDYILEIKYKGHSLSEVLELSINEANELFGAYRKITAKLAPAIKLGLGYLKLGQTSASLSGGEAQRLKIVPFLAKKLQSSHVLILDEPTQGLHFADIAKLLETLTELVSKGITVILIEHNSEVLQSADWIIDLGPGAAERGGRLLYQGPYKGLLKAKLSLTGQALQH